ncbi:MAG: hypothetical protein CMJ18_12235 [Phycisphaeraceae bacterium]|nr:hypothetical protein [Phycisphaeraceae bacterium]
MRTLLTCHLTAVILLVLPVAIGGTASARTIEEIESLNAITLDHVTPHTKWARPYARGSIRALFIQKLTTNVNVAATRDVVEMAQRFDIEADTVLVAPSKGQAYAVTYRGESGVYGGAAGEQRLARLLETPYDCYVIGDHEIAGHLPGAALETILDYVRQGAGLVLPQREAYDAINEHASIGAEPMTAPRSLSAWDAMVIRLGKGRIVSLDVPHRKFHTDNDRDRILGVKVARDAHFAAFGRAVLWAADRAPTLKLDVTFDEEVDWSETGNRSIDVSWTGPPVGDGLRIDARIRGRGRGDHVLEATKSEDPSNDRIRFDMPALPSGDFMVEVTARTDRGVENWSVRPLDVKSRETVGKMGFEREWSEPGDAIIGSVVVNSAHRDRRSLRVQLIDRYGRALVRRDFAAPQESVGFALPTRPSMPGYVAIEAILMQDDRPIHYGYAAHTIVQRRQNDFNFVMWGRLYTGRYHDIAEDLLAASGVTSRLETSEVPWTMMTRAGMSYTPYCTSGIQRQHWTTAKRKHRGRLNRIDLDDDGVLKIGDDGGCWNDEPAVTARLRRWLDAERDFRSHGVLAYSMGDENETIGSCLHPACLESYRRYLHGRYGTIERLNASWGTSFGSFADVELSGPADNSEQKAFAGQNYPRWLDRRSFQAWNFARYVARFGRAARGIDPQARWGVEGTGWLDDDLDAIVRHSNWWVVYSIPAGEVIRSIAPKDYMLGHFVGYSDSNPYYPLSDFWLSFLRGGNCIAWWRIDNFLAPHFGLSDSARELVRTGRVVFDGFGRLLNVESQMQHDGIVMLHSYASSQMASHVAPGPTYGTYTGWVTNSETELDKRGPEHEIDWALNPRGKGHMTWHRAIRSVGLQFEYVTDRMLRLGEFRPDAYRVMILSQCEAIGPREAEAIRRFAHGGGTVIADIRPGLYDGHGGTRSGGALDDLFGVRHTDNVAAVEADGAVDGTIGGRPLDVRLPSLHVNPAVELTTAEALGRAGTTPIVMVNRTGAGRAVLLNFTLNTFPNLSRPEAPESAAKMITALFAQANVQWPLRLLTPDGARGRNVEAVRWKAGDGIEVVAVYGPLDDGRHQWRPREGMLERVRARDVPRTIRLRLPDDRHVTVVGSTEPLGRTRDIPLQLHPWRPKFVVLSEQALKAPTLTPSKTVARRGESLQWRVSVPETNGLHALRLRVTTPDGEAAKWFDRSLIVGPRGAEFDLPVASNEQAGTWKVETTDLYTGKAAMGQFTLP